MSEASMDFRATFDPERQSIEFHLSNLDKLSKDKVQEKIDTLIQRIHALEKSITDKISILPPFETRVCLEAVKSLSEQLNLLRVKLIPRTKFTFKSRKTVATLAVANAPCPRSTGSVTTPSKIPEDVDQSLFMKFENRTGEHLFIGSLQVPSSDYSLPTPMEDVVYLGGVPVDGSKILHSQVREAKDVALTDLTDCTVNLVHDSIPLGAIHIKTLRRCTLIIPPVSGSILLHDCQDCIIVGACHQSRMHTSSNLDIYLHVTSEPIIEDCTYLRFAPYPYHEVLPAEEQLHRLFQVAQLDPEKNFYDRVKDFNWLKQQQSPNWRLLDAQEIRSGIAQSVLAKNRV
ncbi:hypothetical protein BGX28_009210 [Mortierella sp. GBA30]|nr:hypothetical protein BGX28_009210 [Mortierella sp. GBA30]